MTKAENIRIAREHWENRKIGRPIQSWYLPTGERITTKDHVKGAIPSNS